MPGQGRLGDKANITADAHGCPGCPHPGTGPAISGSANVYVNGRPALRVDDVGLHAVCCGGNMWQAQQGSATVFINGKAAFRINDPSHHCGGDGKLIEGSADVLVGDASSGGGGSGGGGAAGSAGDTSNGAASSSPGGATAAESSPAQADSGGASPGGAAAAAPQDPAAQPAEPASPDATSELTFIEIELIGEDGKGIAGERWIVTPKSGPARSGFTDGDGRARVEALDPGQCTVTFPDLDTDAWSRS